METESDPPSNSNKKTKYVVSSFALCLTFSTVNRHLRREMFTGLWCDISISSFAWVYGKVRCLQPSGLMVTINYKHVLLRVCPQPMFIHWLFDLVIRGKWVLKYLKSWLTRVFAGVPVLWCLFSSSSKLQRPSNNRSKKTIIMIFNTFLFYTNRVTSSCIYFVTVLSLALNKYQI